MSARDWSATNFLRYATGVVTAVPVTISAWAITNLTGTVQTIAGLFNSANANAGNSFTLDITTTENVRARTGSSAAVSNAVSSTAVSTNTWFHACGVYASATDRRAFLNGGGKGTEATSRIPSGINRTSIGLQDGLTANAPFAIASVGDIAEVAIWSIALTDQEVLALALGASPFSLQPQNLVAFYPVSGRSAIEVNLVSTTSNLGLNGVLSSGVARCVNRLIPKTDFFS